MVGENRTVHTARQPAQPGQPSCFRPTATRSDDFDCQARVPNLLTRPHVGRLSIFHFKTRNTQPKQNPLSFSTNYEFRTKSNEILSRFVKIWARSGKILSLSDEIWARSQWIRPNFNPSDKTQDRPKSTRNRWDPKMKNPTKSPGRFRVKFSSTHLNRVESELGIN